MGLIRAFISVDIPEDIRKEIRNIQKKLPKFKGKNTEYENLHLTLKFLGWIDEEKLIETRKRLKKIKSKSFEAEIKNIGLFYPRIVWLHLTDFDFLQKEVDDVLSDLFEKEKRFMSHLTIARIKHIEDWGKFRDDLEKISVRKIKFDVKSFKLKKSKLTRSGPIYETIDEYKLS